MFIYFIYKGFHSFMCTILCEFDDRQHWQPILVRVERGESSTSRPDYYRLYKNVCRIPSDVTRRVTLNNVPRVVCREVCSGAHSEHCSGFLYNRRDRSCVLSPFTGERLGHLDLGCTEEETLANRVEFHRRLRKLGEPSYYIKLVYTSTTSVT